jgi:hypothetical protein
MYGVCFALINEEKRFLLNQHKQAHPTAITTCSLTVEFRPRDGKSSFAIRPEVYVGSPVTFQRAGAFIEGVGWALAVATGRPSPISKFHELLYPPTSCEARTEDQEYEAIQTLLPALKALFPAGRARR